MVELTDQTQYDLHFNSGVFNWISLKEIKLEEEEVNIQVLTCI